MQSVGTGIEGPTTCSTSGDRGDSGWHDEGKVPVTALVQLDPSDARHLAELAAQRGLTLPQFLYETAMTQVCVA